MKPYTLICSKIFSPYSNRGGARLIDNKSLMVSRPIALYSLRASAGVGEREKAIQIDSRLLFCSYICNLIQGNIE